MIAIIQALATAPTALPKDASALEASISALKSCISALESSISTLGRSSTLWEWVAIVSSLVVVPGIVGEIIVIVSEYREDLAGWRLGNIFWGWRAIRPTGRPPRWRFWFDIVSTAVVLLGILGEALGSMELASINNSVRSRTNILRAKSDQLLGLITEQAGSAASSAERAQKSAGLAETAARHAQEKADAVGERAQELEKRLGTDALILSAGTSEHFFLPRVFDQIDQYPETVAVTSLLGSGPDTVMFGDELSTAFRSLGWQVIDVNQLQTGREVRTFDVGPSGVAIYCGWWESEQLPFKVPSSHGPKSFSPDMSLMDSTMATEYPDVPWKNRVAAIRLHFALNARIFRDPKLPKDRIIVVVGDFRGGE